MIGVIKNCVKRELNNINNECYDRNINQETIFYQIKDNFRRCNGKGNNENGKRE